MAELTPTVDDYLMTIAHEAAGTAEQSWDELDSEDQAFWYQSAQRWANFARADLLEALGKWGGHFEGCTIIKAAPRYAGGQDLALTQAAYANANQAMGTCTCGWFDFEDTILTYEGVSDG